EPTIPPAPPAFSMITCWPRTSERRRPTMRPSTSVPPAGRERDHHGQRAARPALRDGGAGAVVPKAAHDQSGQHGIARTHVGANCDSSSEMSLLLPAIGTAQ